MKVPDIFGRETNVNLSKYYVNWGGKEASKFQYEVKQFLKDFWHGDIVCSEFRIPKSKLRIDLINFSKGIVLESSGEQHFKPNRWMHGGKDGKIGFLASLKRDDKKLNYVEKHLNFQFLELRMSDMKDLSYQMIIDRFGVDILEKYI